MNVLVTGSSGFLGKFLCEKLRLDGHQVVALTSKLADLRQQGSLAAYDKQKFDVIYHLAAWTQAGDFCLYHPGEQWVINQQINTNVVEWWQRAQRQGKLVTMGTSCSYAPGSHLSEEEYLLGEPIESLYTYGMTKRMLQVGLQSLNKQYGLQYLTFVPSTLYGPDYHNDGRQMHFIFDLVRKILRGREYGETVSLWGDGYQKRELVYVEDFVQIMARLTATQSNQVINIGAGVEYTIRDFAERICRIVGYPHAKIQYDTSKYVGAKSKCLSTKKLRKLIPDLQLTDLNVGLEKTINWFLTSKAFE